MRMLHLQSLLLLCLLLAVPPSAMGQSDRQYVDRLDAFRLILAVMAPVDVEHWTEADGRKWAEDRGLTQADSSMLLLCARRYQRKYSELAGELEQMHDSFRGRWVNQEEIVAQQELQWRFRRLSEEALAELQMEMDAAAQGRLNELVLGEQDRLNRPRTGGVEQLKSDSAVHRCSAVAHVLVASVTSDREAAIVGITVAATDGYAGSKVKAGVNLRSPDGRETSGVGKFGYLSVATTKVDLCSDEGCYDGESRVSSLGTQERCIPGVTPGAGQQ